MSVCVCVCVCVCVGLLRAHYTPLQRYAKPLAIDPVFNLVCLLGSGRPADCKSVHLQTVLNFSRVYSTFHFFLLTSGFWVPHRNTS